MINEKQLKQDIFNAIDSEAEFLKNYADDIRKHPELGFEEFRTSDRMAEYMSHLGLPVKRNLAITGVQGDLNMSETGILPLWVNWMLLSAEKLLMPIL